MEKKDWKIRIIKEERGRRGVEEFESKGEGFVYVDGIKCFVDFCFCWGVSKYCLKNE